MEFKKDIITIEIVKQLCMDKLCTMENWNKTEESIKKVLNRFEI